MKATHICHLADQVRQLVHLKTRLARVLMGSDAITLKGNIRRQIGEIERELKLQGVKP